MNRTITLTIALSAIIFTVSCSKKHTTPLVVTSDSVHLDKLHNQLYGTDSVYQIMDILYHPNSDNSRPLIILIHGGSWVRGSKDDFSYTGVDTFFAQNGYVVASINFRLFNTFTYTNEIEDIGNAINYLITNAATWHIDTNRISLLGRSSGAHLAMLYGYKMNVGMKIKSIVDCYGPTDLTDTSIRKRSFDSSVSYVFGDYTANQLNWRNNSPSYFAGAAIPTLIMHGTTDTLVPFTQAKLLADSLIAKNVPCTFIPWENSGHNWNADYWTRDRNTVLAFVNKYGK